MSERRKIAYALLNGFAVGVAVSMLIFNYQPERFWSVRTLVTKSQLEGACFAFRELSKGIPEQEAKANILCKGVRDIGEAAK